MKDTDFLIIPGIEYLGDIEAGNPFLIITVDTLFNNDEKTKGFIKFYEPCKDMYVVSCYNDCIVFSAGIKKDDLMNLPFFKQQLKDLFKYDEGYNEEFCEFIADTIVAKINEIEKGDVLPQTPDTIYLDMDELN